MNLNPVFDTRFFVGLNVCLTFNLTKYCNVDTQHHTNIEERVWLLLKKKKVTVPNFN